MEHIAIIDRNKDQVIEVDGKKIQVWNGYYKTYTAAYCKTLGLPMLNNSTYEEYADKWLSPSRCKKAGKPVQENENPIAFYKVNHGYCPLYDRT